jgi:hypothetical protein
VSSGIERTNPSSVLGDRLEIGWILLDRDSPRILPAISKIAAP